MSGSSPILLNINVGPKGPTGPDSQIKGITGPTGSTGDCGNVPEGVGIRDYTIEYPYLKIFYGGGNGSTLTITPTPGVTGQFGLNDTYYTFRGATTLGYSILYSSNPSEHYTNIINYDNLKDGTRDIPKFRGLVANSIVITETETCLTITGTTPNPVSVGNTGDLLYIKDVGSINIIAGTTANNNWDITNRKLEINVPFYREADVSGSTYTQDNYRTLNINATSAESQYISIGVNGCTFNNTFVKPISTIDGITHTQSGLYFIKDNNNNENSQVILRFIQQDAISVAAGRKNYSPQSVNMEFGSCCVGGDGCIEYTTFQYCEHLGGTFDAWTRCSSRTDECNNLTSCCYYDYSSGGIKCINTTKEECECYMGKSGNTRCASMTTQCPSDVCCPTDNPGTCCYKGNCTQEFKETCESFGGTWTTGDLC